MSSDTNPDQVYDARQVANYLLDLADAERRPLTQLALLKLVYFTHGWYLAEHGAPLIKNRFEAWPYGPVVKVLYQQFRDSGDQPISTRAYFFDPVTQESKLAEPRFTNYVQNFIYAVYKEYSKFTAYALSNLTHEMEGPWDKVWNNATGQINPGLIISDGEMMTYFRRIARESPLH